MLTVKQIQSAREGRHSDGKGLYLNVSPTGKKTWILRYSRERKVTEASLGSAEFIGLSDARAKAFEFRKSLVTGIVTPRRVTFEVLAREHVRSRLQSLKNPLIAEAAYDRYLRQAKPLCDLDVGSLTIDQVAAVLRPLWIEKSQTADRIRSLIESVCDLAIVKGLRVTPNPAKYKGVLSHVLGRRLTLTRGHQRALPYAEVPALMRRLESEGGVIARALRLTILCALRKSEVQGLRTEHVQGDMLVLPAGIMKMKKEFRVPLSAAALTVLEEQRAFGTNGFVFPSPLRAGRPLSPNSFNELLSRMKVPATPHGFRSSFRDFSGDMTDAPREVAEAALAHSVLGVEGAYKRTDFYGKRRDLMQAWGTFLVGA